jgi:hypothetical protein
MGWFGIGKAKVGGLDATVTFGERGKTGKERLINRVGSIKTALEGVMPEPKRGNLKAELRSILSELNAREEAVDAIMAKFED